MDSVRELCCILDAQKRYLKDLCDTIAIATEEQNNSIKKQTLAIQEQTNALNRIAESLLKLSEKDN